MTGAPGPGDDWVFEAPWQTQAQINYYLSQILLLTSLLGSLVLSRQVVYLAAILSVVTLDWAIAWRFGKPEGVT